MRKTERISLILTLMLSLLMVIPAHFVATSGPPSERNEANYSKIDSLLLSEMLTHGSEEKIEIIAQFQGSVEKKDLNEMRELGIEPVHIFHVIPAVYAEGRVKDVLALSGYSRTYWLEYNSRNKLYLDKTTGIINATTAWTSEVKDGDYRGFDKNSQSELMGIDGRGVTVAVVDTGIDGQHPDLDYGKKLIMNKHKNGPNDPWVEMENSDTSYGHGTHCAGIVAGNGDASAGRRRGVAPGATLIGVGGDWTPVYWAVLEGLEWVYDHSRPGNNPYNIRVVSNSWGGAGDYDPQDSITQIANKLTYENNVVCVFAAGNDGSDDHDGSTDTTSQQSKIPSVISVAATTHDGKGMATFSSRGKKGEHITYPDISAPGVDIWATRPRYTWLGEYQLIDEDMYYMAISGTSMATPHVSGLVALLFQAAPSLRVSEHHEDYNGNETGWGEREDTRIHEAEYILKMTADYIQPSEGNGVPDSSETGISGRQFDYAQGYGLVNAKRAVAVALTLEKMRESHPDATVDDALKEYGKVCDTAALRKETDTLKTEWRGEWAQLTNGSNPLSTTVYATDQHHRVYIPEDSRFLEFDLSYNPINANTMTGGSIDVTLDWNGDGQNDISAQPFDVDGKKHYEVDLTSGDAAGYRGRFWTFNVEGTGIKPPVTNPDDEFHEALIEYTIRLTLYLSPSADVSIDEKYYTTDTSPWEFGERSEDYSGGSVTLERNIFDVTDVEYTGTSVLEEYRVEVLSMMTVILVAAGIGGLFNLRRRDR